LKVAQQIMLSLKIMNKFYRFLLGWWYPRNGSLTRR